NTTTSSAPRMDRLRELGQIPAESCAKPAANQRISPRQSEQRSVHRPTSHASDTAAKQPCRAGDLSAYRYWARNKQVSPEPCSSKAELFCATAESFRPRLGNCRPTGAAHFS